MNKAILGFLMLLLCSCLQDKSSYTVKHHGALINIMGGNLEATVSLDSIPKDHLYALGAIENLKGEIQIFNGDSFISQTKNSNDVNIIKDTNHKASLLVYAQVEEWTSPQLLDSFSTSQELEQQIKTIALEKGIDVNRPFPFLLEGSVKEMKWHVINWPDNDLIHTHKKHQESGAHGLINNRTVKILGFYSEKHKAVFTHHSTFLHMHFKTDDDPIIAGHVDHLQAYDLYISLPQ